MAFSRGRFPLKVLAGATFCLSMSTARDRRIWRAERANLIARLGLEPEEAPGQYVATTGEFWTEVARNYGVAEAEACRAAAERVR